MFGLNTTGVVPDSDVTQFVCLCNDSFFPAPGFALLLVCFLFKLHGILVAPALHSSYLTLPDETVFFNWNLNVRDLNTDDLRYSLSQNYWYIAHEQLTFFLSILDGRSRVLFWNN